MTTKSWPEELEIGEITLKDIVKELEKPARDPRDEMPRPILRTDVLNMEDLKEGHDPERNCAECDRFRSICGYRGSSGWSGTYFPDERDSYIKHPLEAVSVGDVVDVQVIGVDLKKKRISLSMKGFQK